MALSPGESGEDVPRESAPCCEVAAAEGVQAPVFDFDILSPACPSRTVLRHVVDRWTPLVVTVLADGPSRFGELRARVGGVTPKVLTQTLRSMERDGLVTRTQLPGVPPRVDYELTDLGRSLQAPIDALRTFLDRKVPFFGICLGHQLLGLAVGGRTVKMKFGHHGANHPVKDLDTGRVSITSQNHGFAVDADSLPARVRVTHVSLFDGSLQGIELTDAPAFSFQGHPEASPGPHDVIPLFERFARLMAEHRSL